LVCMELDNFLADKDFAFLEWFILSKFRLNNHIIKRL
jgi:hypothetical protein